VAGLPRMVAVPVPNDTGHCAGALGAELPHPASLADIRRCLPVLHHTAALLRRGA
jgi:DNA-binding IclR family transcriptional regulator